MTILYRAAQSLEYVMVPVTTTDEDEVAVDPTGDIVALAFVNEGESVITGSLDVDDDTKFFAATWETGTVDGADVYRARLLVGPTGDYEPVAGSRIDVWVRVTDNPEAPLIRSGTIRFT